MRCTPVVLMSFLSASLFFAVQQAEASGRGASAGPRASHGQASYNQGWRGGPNAHFGDVRGQRRDAGRLHGRRNQFGGFYGYPFAFGNDAVATRDEGRESEPRRFDPLPASTGIPYPPAGDPVIYRIERDKGRAFVRVLRFGNDSQGSARRLARDETGPRVVTVPR